MWFTLSMVSFALQPASGQNFTLPVFLAVFACLWAIAAAFVRQSGRSLPVVPSIAEHLGILLILSGGAMLCVELSVRLLASSQHFGGQAVALDFGLKCGAAQAGQQCQRQNLAFTPELNSVGHCLQGVLVALLVPAVQHSLLVHSDLQQRTVYLYLMLLRTCGAFTSVYPCYNVVKRTRRGQVPFAASSFPSNGMEWAMGFLLGISLGIATMAREHHLGSTVVVSPLSVQPRLLGFRQEAMVQGGWRVCVAVTVAVLQVVSGLMLCAAAVIAAVLLGTSWDNTAADPAFEDATDSAALALMLAVPIVCSGCWAAYASVIGCAGGTVALTEGNRGRHAAGSERHVRSVTPARCDSVVGASDTAVNTVL